MAKLDLSFIHVDDNTVVEAELEDHMTAGQVIQALISNDFLQRPNDPRQTYSLSIKGGSIIADGQSLAQAGVRNGDQIRVIMAQRGGAEGAKKLFVHAMRLKSDFESMRELDGSVISWKPLTPCDPAKNTYPSVYEVTFNILAPTTSGKRRQHTVKIDCSSPSYPSVDPTAMFTTAPVKHPHVYEDGRICIGRFSLGEPLAAFCVRLARFIQFDPLVINDYSIASRSFNNWYRENISLFPMDSSLLPSIGLESPITLKKAPTEASSSSSETRPSPAGAVFRIHKRSGTSDQA